MHANNKFDQRVNLGRSWKKKEIFQVTQLEKEMLIPIPQIL